MCVNNNIEKNIIDNLIKDNIFLNKSYKEVLIEDIKAIKNFIKENNDRINYNKTSEEWVLDFDESIRNHLNENNYTILNARDLESIIDYYIISFRVQR